MRNLIRIGFITICSIFIYSAGYSQDFEVAPVVMNFNANPGEIQKQILTIKNHGNTKQAFSFNLGDFEIDKKGIKKRMKAGESTRSCADWLTITPSFIELNPNESKPITVLMTVPKSGNGTKWSYIYAQATSEQKEGAVDKQLSAGILVKPRIAILVIQSPGNNKNYKAEIANLKRIKSDKEDKRCYQVYVKNTGDKIIEAKVNLALANLKTAEEKKFKKEKHRVFPGEERAFELYMDKDIAPGKYALAAILDYGHGTALEAAQILLDIK